MPDCILQHIFFFLSTKDVFRTSILSRRWQYLWTSLSNLDLECKIFCDFINDNRREMLKNNFLEFVNRVFAFHDASVIRRLRLSSDCLPDKFSRLNSWISIAVEHNVEDLELLLGWQPQCELPCSLFTCRSLVLLNIDSRLTLKAPPDTCFLNLKKLLLANITFADELSIQHLFSNSPLLVELELVNCNCMDSRLTLKALSCTCFLNLKKLLLSEITLDELSIQQLFSCFPVLDELKLVCEWEDIKNATISVPSIRNLSIIGDTSEGYSLGGRYEEDFADPHVKIIAANLACLEFSSYLDVDFEFMDMSSLKMVSLNLPYDDAVEPKVATRALRLFSWISSVECLYLSAMTIECLTRVEASLDHLPTFYSLTRLTVDELYYGFCAVYLLQYLEKMPNLEYLELNQGPQEPIWTDDQVSLRDKIMRQIVPSCFNSSLKTFAIKEFEGELHERLMIEYVLKNVTVLEYLCISCSKRLEKETLSKFKDCLGEVPRGSESCVIKFSSS